MQTAHDHLGRLDVVVNNAGYGQFGFIEELSEAEARDRIEANVFGALWISTWEAWQHVAELAQG